MKDVFPQSQKCTSTISLLINLLAVCMNECVRLNMKILRFTCFKICAFFPRKL